MSQDRTGFPAPLRALPAFDGPFDAHRLEASGCEVLFASYPAGTDIAEHDHDTHNVGVITRGELVLTRGSRQERYGPGDWYEIQPNEPHAARFDIATGEIDVWFDADST